jgi:hypothetical protein
MADTKVTDLTELEAPDSADLLYVVDDPGGSPASKKATIENVVAGGLGTAQKTRTINYLIGGATTAIASGIVKGDIMWDYAAELQAWTLLADQAGTITIDVWSANGTANFPPTNAASICNGHEPAIAAGTTWAQDTDLSDWSDTSIAEGDIWRLNVDGCGTITSVTAAFKVLV